MGVKENKALARCIFELADHGELDKLFSLCAPDYVNHRGDRDISMEELKKSDEIFFSAFPDVKITVKDLIAEGDKVVARVSWKGTHKGEFMGMPPTDKKIEITYAAIIRIANGRISEVWNFSDNLSLLQQLGVIPKQLTRRYSLSKSDLAIQPIP